MKICILADSEALPRGETWGNTPFETTYPFLLDIALRRRFGVRAPYLLTKGTRLRTTHEVLQDWFEEVELRRCEFAIVQVGGGDCAPRALMPRERKAIERIPFRWIRQLIFAIEKKYRRQIVTWFPNRVLVPVEAYRANIRAIIRRADESGLRGLIFINIPEISDHVEYQLPGVRACGHTYNQVMEEEVGQGQAHLIRLNQLMLKNGGADSLTVDGTHLNQKGQQLLAGELERLLVDLIEAATGQPNRPEPAENLPDLSLR